MKGSLNEDMKTSQLLIHILKTEVQGLPLDDSVKSQLSEEMLADLFALAQKHDLAQLVLDCIEKNKIELSAPLQEKYGSQKKLAIYRFIKLEYQQEEAFDLLKKHEICFMPLKGSLIRSFYPEGWMRPSCDIDIFVKKEDVERTVSLFESELGFTAMERGVHDIALVSPSDVHLELHFDLTDGNSKYECLFADLWREEFREDDSCKYVMDNTLMGVYHIIHMVQHFRYGGCGIRPVLDLSLIMPHFPMERIICILETVGLKTFALSAAKLAQVWFGEAEHDEVTLRLEEFIFSSGLYGTDSNKVAVGSIKEKNKFKYVLDRIFLPYQKLKNYYPKLQKYPFLLPYYEIKRIFRLLSPQRRRSAVNEMKAFSIADSQKQSNIEELYRDLEII